MAGSDRDAFHVKNRTDVLRMRAVHHEREDGGLVRRGTDDAQNRYFRQTPRAVFEQRGLMCGGGGEIGSASCGERVWSYVYFQVCMSTLNKNSSVPRSTTDT